VLDMPRVLRDAGDYEDVTAEAKDAAAFFWNAPDRLEKIEVYF